MLTRRSMSKIAALTPLILSAAQSANAKVAGSAPALDMEIRSLDELHKAALAEGGKLVVYGGGDLPNGAAGMEQAFSKRFPGMSIRILIDRSKYQGVRIDNQLDLDALQCDVAHILAWHYFERWKANGELLAYKPLGWEAVYPDFKDPDGMITSVAIYAFSSLINKSKIATAEAPREALDFLSPKLKGQIALTYPQDDDSILYQFERIVAEHGWDYVEKLMKQDILWNRGSGVTRKRVESGEAAASFTTSGPIVAIPKGPTEFLLPSKGSFLSWAHPGAIFKKAKNPAAAKLYMSWLLSEDIQGTKKSWSVRDDMPAPDGMEPIFGYKTYPIHFREFLRDRARIETFRDQLDQYIGPMQGDNPTKVVGVFPEGRV